MIKFCPMCGTKIITDSRFCNSCGLNLVEYQKKLDKLAATTPTDANKSTPQTETPVVGVPVKAKDTIKAQKQLPTPVESKAVVPQKDKTSQPVAIVEEDLSAEELFERGLLAKSNSNFKKAVEYFTRAIRLKHIEAIFQLGLIYDPPIRSALFFHEVDRKKALAFFLKAAELGSVEAMTRLGRIYFSLENGEDEPKAEKYGLVKDEEKAFHYFSRADLQNDPTAAAYLGYLFYEKEDYETARYCWARALDFGFTKVYRGKPFYHYIGEMYINGLGVPKIIPVGLQWYLRGDISRNEKTGIDYLLYKNEAIKKATIESLRHYKFELGTYELNFRSDNIINSLEVITDTMLNIRPKIDEALAKFGVFYEGQKNIDNVVAKARGYGNSLLEDFAGKCVKSLSIRTQKNMTARDFISASAFNLDYSGVYSSANQITLAVSLANKMGVPADIWESGTNKIAGAYRRIVEAAQSERDYREARKENRARWHGSGYNISSAINAELKAGMMNMAEGAAHGVWNFFGNMSTDATEASNKQELYNSADTLMIYCYHLREAMKIISNRLLLTLGNYEYVNDTEKSQKIIENVRNGHVNKDNIQENLVNAILNDPFNLEAYALYLKKFDDFNCGVRHLTLFLGLDKEIETLKKNIFVERMKKSGHQFKLFSSDSLFEYMWNINTEKLPSYEELQEDFEIIGKAALNLNLNLYGNDSISYVAYCYRLLIYAYEQEQAADKNDDKRIPAFKYMNQKDLGDVVIPERIETIGAFAFANSSMKSIKFPSTLKKIETGAFFKAHCETRVFTIPEGTEEFAINMAWGMSGYGFIQLPSSIKRITGEPRGFEFKNFQGTEKYSGILFCFEPYLADTVVEYFKENNLIQYTNILTREKFKAQDGNLTESEVFISGVLNDREIYGKKFDGKPFEIKFRGVYYRNAEKSFIGLRAFSDSHVKAIEFEDPVKIIRDEAFSNCQDLESLRLPSGLEKIGSRVFSGCENLKYVMIPNTVKIIGDDILQSCPAVIYCDSNSFAAAYCRKNNLPMKDYGVAKLQEGREILKTSKTREEFCRALECFVEAAYIGNIDGSYEAGKCFVVDRDFVSAVKYFKQAAERHNKESMVELYKIYKNAPEAKYKSQNIEQNVKEAAKWLALSGYGGTEIETASEITKVTNYGELIQFKENLYAEFNDVSCLYFPHKDSKSKEKLRKAQASYAQNIKDENVICVFDNTLFGGADDGFLVTDKKIYAHNAYAKDIIVIPFGEIKSFGIIKNSLLINGTIEISIGNGGNSAKETLPIMLEKIKCVLAGDEL